MYERKVTKINAHSTPEADANLILCGSIGAIHPFIYLSTHCIYISWSKYVLFTSKFALFTAPDNAYFDEDLQWVEF